MSTHALKWEKGGHMITTVNNATINNAAATPVKVLWFSRHPMTAPQRLSLEKKLGILEVVQVNKTISNVDEIADDVKAADVICIVAPPELQQQFVKAAGARPVLVAVSDRVLVPDPNGGEDKAEFVFRRWDRIKKFILEIEEFCS